MSNVERINYNPITKSSALRKNALYERMFEMLHEYYGVSEGAINAAYELANTDLESRRTGNNVVPISKAK